MIPKRLQVVGEAPVGELAAVEQHHRGGERVDDLVIAGPRRATDRLAVHVAAEQLGDVANREDVGIGDDRPPLVAKQAGDGEPHRRERLEVVGVPVTLMPAAHERMAALLKLREFARIDDPDLERVGRPAVAAEAVRGNERAQHLLVVGVDDDGRLHHRPYLGGE